jgi:hypothetical protein
MTKYEKFCVETGLRPNERDFWWAFDAEDRMPRPGGPYGAPFRSDHRVLERMIEWVNGAKDIAIELNWHSLAEAVPFKSPAYLWCVFLGKE